MGSIHFQPKAPERVTGIGWTTALTAAKMGAIGSPDNTGGQLVSKVNTNFKASVFSHLFRTEENERGLYGAFSPSWQPEDSAVVDLTLEDVLFMDRVNDLAFSVGGTLACFF
jgi:hypothetical protein